jgi:hypothetical protein
VAQLDNVWWGPLEAALRANPLPGPAQIALRRALLGVDAVLIGAAWLAQQAAAEDLTRRDASHPRSP